MARRRVGRNIHGIVLLNKPSGISSNAALQKVKRLFQARKAGHTGSLDGLASGLLPICLGEATKISRFLLDADKHYQAECTLGIKTTTGDTEGNVLKTCSIDGIDRQVIDVAIQKFTGQIQQVPPMYSALKHQGQPLYKLARQGKTVERKARLVTIYDIMVQDFVDNRLSLAVHCSKGTYIRTLAEDIGETLGCGATISALHRTQVGIYRDMVAFETLENCAKQGLSALNDWLMPMQTALNDLPDMKFSEKETHCLQQGQTVYMPHTLKEGWVKLFSDTDFFGIGQVLSDNRIVPKRIFNFGKVVQYK